MDTAMGNKQKGDTCWARTNEYFDAYNTSGIEQADRSFCSRWATISGECKKWSSMLAQVERINPSGTSDKGMEICSVTSLVIFVLFLM
jgi:hypothetical protein